MSENDERDDYNVYQASERCSGEMDNCVAEEEKEEDMEEEGEDEEEEEDTDFNPCLIAEEEVSEASSSLSSEDEGSADNPQRQPVLHLNNQCGERDGKTANIGEREDDHDNNIKGELRSISIEDCGTSEQKISNEEDAICMRTRARHSLANYSLEVLETFLQESDDDDDLQHVDDEEEYRKFLSAVLSSGDNPVGERDMNENVDEDEENDADFEIEIEEALDSDADENNQETHNWKENKMKERGGVGMRQKRTQKASVTCKSSNIQLRPISPTDTNTQLDSTLQSQGWHSLLPQMAPNFHSKAEQTCGFTSQQIGQLFCLINEHVQLLVQVFSLSIHDPTKQQVANKMESLIVEISDKREEALASRKTPYPHYCFDYTDAYHSVMGKSSWFPPVANPLLSILDVKPLAIGKKYIDDVSSSIFKYKRDQVEGKLVRSQLKKEPLFTRRICDISQETTAEVIDGADTNIGSLASILSSNVQQKKITELSIALVPSDIATLAQTFSPLFNPSLFPLKPPPSAVANRALFTASEDGLLALGLMEYNNDWKAIRQRFLPCKTEHQIFIRQKNRASSKAPENPIKAVRRLKTAPLSPEEKVLIAEGLKVFKHEWISVWRYFVPHRDPSTLPRQWRIATGTQKSYRKDETMNKKRRLYEARRRKSRASKSEWNSTLSEHEMDDPDNEDEAYVHEAFLADNEHVGYEDQDPANHQFNGFLPSLKSMGQQMVKPSLPSSSRQVHYSYKMRKKKGAQVVKLAPELPPVNLPPTVRVISQSTLRNYPPSLTLSTADKTLRKIAFPRLTQMAKHDISRNTTLQDPREESNCETDMQLHPLLFQMGDTDLELYRSTTSSQLSGLKIPRLGSEKLTLMGTTSDFHPLFLKMDGQPTESEALPDKSQPSDSSVFLHEKDGGVDLVDEGRFVVSGTLGSGNMLNSSEQLSGEPVNDIESELPDPASIEIVMEHEELSDSEEEVDNVEFECEEMDDSDGEDVGAGSVSKNIEKD